MASPASSFSFPVLSVVDIVSFLRDRGIASVSVADLSAPSSDLVCSLYSTILADLLDPSSFEADSQIDFSALELLQNPQHHVESIRKTLLFRTIRSFLFATQFGEFFFKDLLFPEPGRTTLVLSSIINFLLHREDKMNMLQPIVDQLPKFEEERMEIEARLSELEQEALEYETAREMEQLVVEQLEAEVKDIKQNLLGQNKGQMALKARAMSLKAIGETLKDELSQADFELVKNAQENSNLMSRIVQSPDKLQRAIEEKKSLKSEVVNAERSALLILKERTSKVEVLTKACEKMSRQFKKLEDIHEEVNSYKVLDKEVKAIKAKLSDDELVKNKSLDSQIVELQGKVTQAENSVEEMVKMKGIKFAEQTKKLDSAKLEIEQKMQIVKQREVDAEVMRKKGERNLEDINNVKEARRIQETEILQKTEELANEYHKYAIQMNPILQIIVSEIASVEDIVGVAD